MQTIRCVEVNGLTVQIPHFALGVFDWLWVLESERKPPAYASLSLSLCIHLANQDFMDFLFLIFPKATLNIFVLSAVPIRRGFEMDTETLWKTSVNLHCQMIWRHDSHGHDVYAAKPARVRIVVCRNFRVAICF